MVVSESILNLAFNQGSDARLKGVPVTQNPWHSSAHASWRKGWLHVDKYWGSDLYGLGKERALERLPHGLNWFKTTKAA